MLNGCAAGSRHPAAAPAVVAGAGAPPRQAAPPAPWQLPGDAFPTQSLFRVSVSGSEGDGSVKLTLRLAAADRFQVRAADPLGRGLWDLDVAGDRGLWLDHRSRTFCRLTGAVELAVLPLGPLSPLALPPMLLGRLPVPPGVAAEVVTRPLAGAPGVAGVAGGGGDDISFHDAAGRRWGAVVKDGRVLSWTLWPPGGTGAGPLLSWVAAAGAGADAGWAELTDRRKGVRARWRQVLREPLRDPLPALPEAAGGAAIHGDAPLPAPFAGYRQVVCGRSPGQPGAPGD